jgi:hypothetical protein
MRPPALPRVAARRQQHHRQHQLEDDEAEVMDKVVGAVDKQMEAEETEAAPRPGALGRHLKETPTE